ncbi:MAG TPA: TraR/DksA C4-type zinc finger protein [Acidimicrobiales bacterium]
MSNDAVIAAQRTQLEQERAELRRQLAELGFGDDGGSGLNYDPNFADSSQVTAERGEAEALANSLREALDEVERALQKVTDGTYGTCESCGDQIAEPRLEAMPAARYCITCASAKR